MKIQFTEKSFKQIFQTNLKDMWERTWVYKFYYFFRYLLPRFFKNVWLFRTVLWRFRWWDSHYTLNMLKRSLELMRDGLDRYGNEVDYSRNKKIAKINRAIELITNKLDDTYIERAELELGDLTDRMFEFEPTGSDLYVLVDNRTDEEKEHDNKVFDLTREMEEREWRELWDIFKGQPVEEYKAILESSFDVDRNKNEDLYNNWYDGSDMRGWWD
jgi:hypothetical protein